MSARTILILAGSLLHGAIWYYELRVPLDNLYTNITISPPVGISLFCSILFLLKTIAFSLLVIESIMAQT